VLGVGLAWAWAVLRFDRNRVALEVGPGGELAYEYSVGPEFPDSPDARGEADGEAQREARRGAQREGNVRGCGGGGGSGGGGGGCGHGSGGASGGSSGGGSGGGDYHGAGGGGDDDDGDAALLAMLPLGHLRLAHFTWAKPWQPTSERDARQWSRQRRALAAHWRAVTRSLGLDPGTGTGTVTDIVTGTVKDIVTGTVTDIVTDIVTDTGLGIGTDAGQESKNETGGACGGGGGGSGVCAWLASEAGAAAVLSALGGDDSGGGGRGGDGGGSSGGGDSGGAGAGAGGFDDGVRTARLGEMLEDNLGGGFLGELSSGSDRGVVLALLAPRCVDSVACLRWRGM